MDELKRTKSATAPAMMPGTYVRAPSIERTEARRALCEAARPAAADAPWLGGGGDAKHWFARASDASLWWLVLPALVVCGSLP